MLVNRCLDTTKKKKIVHINPSLSNCKFDLFISLVWYFIDEVEIVVNKEI